MLSSPYEIATDCEKMFGMSRAIAYCERRARQGGVVGSVYVSAVAILSEWAIQRHDLDRMVLEAMNATD